MGDLLIEVSPGAGQPIYSEDLGPAAAALESFRSRAGEVAESISEVATSLKEHLDSMLKNKEALAPDEVEVNFGLELQAGASTVISKVTANCTFNVKLTWTRTSRPQ